MRASLSIATAAVFLAAGCTSLEDVRARPASWQQRFPGSYESLTNCMAAQYAGVLTVLPQFNSSEKRSNIIVTYPAAQSVMAEFDLRQVAPKEVEITFRQRYSVLGQEAGAREARERADRCAKDS